MSRGPQKLTDEQHERIDGVRALTAAKKAVEQQWEAEITAARGAKVPARLVADAAGIGMTSVHYICNEHVRNPRR